MTDKVDLSIEGELANIMMITERDNDYFVDYIETELPELVKLLFKQDDMFYDPAEFEEKGAGGTIPTPATGSHTAFSGGEGGRNEEDDDEDEEDEDNDRKMFSKAGRRSKFSL